MKKIPTALLIIFLLNGVNASEISFGSITGTTSMDIEAGESGVFSMYFFNIGSNPIDLELKADCPSDIRVDIVPRRRTLHSEITSDPDPYSTYFIMGDGKTFARIYPVKIQVRMPDAISKHIYRIKITAIAKASEESRGSGVRQEMAQVRQYTLTVHTSGTIRGKISTGKEDIEYDRGPVEIEEEYGGFETETTPGGEGGKAAVSGEGMEKTGEDRDEDKAEETGGFLGIKQDDEGNTNIDLPTGRITMDKKQTETAIDVGIITLAISIISLMVRILK